MHLGFLELRTMVSNWQERGPDSQPGRANIAGVRDEVEREAAAKASNAPPPPPADGAAAPPDSDMAPPPPPPATNGDGVKRELDGGSEDRGEKRRRYD